jgi:hypothetical protein
MKPSYKPVKTGFYVRAMSPLGMYPVENFQTAICALIVSPELCFSIVQIRKEDWGFSEVDCLNACELPLFGSVLLAGKPNTPYLYAYPSPFSLILETQTLEEINENSIAECKSHLLESLREKLSDSYSASYFHKPPILGGRDYTIVPEVRDESDQLHVLTQLEKSDPVMLRGVNCLLKGRMAFKHFEFGEAACIYLWIALDAAHSLVLRILRASGIANPTSADAARYFENLSGVGSHWEKFFEDDYENRIRAIHPDNRFGAESIPQFLADDFLELNDELIPLFRYLIDVVPDFVPDAD